MSASGLAFSGERLTRVEKMNLSYEKLLKSHDWNSPFPPPGYKFGIGRGAKPISSSTIDGSGTGSSKKKGADGTELATAEKAFFGSLDELEASRRRHIEAPKADEVGVTPNGSAQHLKLSLHAVEGVERTKVAQVASSRAEGRRLGGAEGGDDEDGSAAYDMVVDSTSGGVAGLDDGTRMNDHGSSMSFLRAIAGNSNSSGGSAYQHQSTNDILTTGDDRQPATWLRRARRLHVKGEARLALGCIKGACKKFGSANAVVWKELLNYHLGYGPYSATLDHSISIVEDLEGGGGADSATVTEGGASLEASLARLFTKEMNIVSPKGRRPRDEGGASQPDEAAEFDANWLGKLCAHVGGPSFAALVRFISKTVENAPSQRAVAGGITEALRVAQEALVELRSDSRTSLALTIDAPSYHEDAPVAVAPGATQLWICFVMLHAPESRLSAVAYATSRLPACSELWWMHIKAALFPESLPASVSFGELGEERPDRGAALALYTAAIKANPLNAALVGLLAFEYFSRGDVGSARRAFLDAIGRHRSSGSPSPPPLELMLISAAFEERAMVSSEGGAWLVGPGGAGSIPSQTSLVAMLLASKAPNAQDPFATHLQRLKLIVNKAAKFYLQEEANNRIAEALRIKQEKKDEIRRAQGLREDAEEDDEANTALRSVVVAERELDAMFGRNRTISVNGQTYDSESLNPIRIRKRVYSEWLQAALSTAVEGYVWVASFMVRELVMMSYGTKEVPPDWLRDVLGLCDTATDEYLHDQAQKGRIGGRLRHNLCGSISLTLQALGPHAAGLSGLISTTSPLECKWRSAALLASWTLLVYTHSVAEPTQHLQLPPSVKQENFEKESKAAGLHEVDFDTQAARAATSNSFFEVLGRVLHQQSAEEGFSPSSIRRYLATKGISTTHNRCNCWGPPLFLHLLMSTSYLAARNCGLHPPTIAAAEIADMVSSLLIGSPQQEHLMDSLRRLPLVTLAVAKTLFRCDAPHAAEPILRFALGTFECVASAVHRGRDVVGRRLREQGDAELSKAETLARGSTDVKQEAGSAGWYDAYTQSLVAKQRADEALRRQRAAIMDSINQRLRHCDSACEALTSLAVASTERILIALSKAIHARAHLTKEHSIYDDLGSVEIATLLDQYLRPASANDARAGLKPLQSSGPLWRKRLTYDREPLLVAVGKFLRAPGEQNQRFPQWLLDRFDAYRSLLDQAVSDGVCPSEPVVWMLNLQEYSLRLHINRGLCDDVDKTRTLIREAGRVAMHSCPLDLSPPQVGKKDMFTHIASSPPSSSPGGSHSRGGVTPYFCRTVQLWVVLVREVLCETLSDQTGARVICSEACSKLLQLMAELERAEGSKGQHPSAEAPISWAVGDAVASMFVVWGSTEHQHHTSDQRWQLLRSQLVPITRSYALSVAEMASGSAADVVPDGVVGGSFPEALAVVKEGVNKLAALYAKVHAAMVHTTGRPLAGLEIPTFLQSCGLGALAELYALWITLDSPLTKGGTIGSVLGLRRIRHPSTHRALVPYLLAQRRPLDAVAELRKAIEGAQGGDGDAWVLITWMAVCLLNASVDLVGDVVALENAPTNSIAAEQLLTIVENIGETIVGRERLLEVNDSLPTSWKMVFGFEENALADTVSTLRPTDHDLATTRQLKLVCATLVTKAACLLPAVVRLACQRLDGTSAPGICTNSSLWVYAKKALPRLPHRLLSFEDQPNMGKGVNVLLACVATLLE